MNEQDKKEIQDMISRSWDIKMFKSFQRVLKKMLCNRKFAFISIVIVALIFALIIAFVAIFSIMALKVKTEIALYLFSVVIITTIISMMVVMLTCIISLVVLICKIRMRNE